MTDPVDRVRQLELRIAELERAVGRRRRLRLPRISLARRLVVVGMIVATALPAGVVLAAHQFTDVPDSHTFHSSIGRIAEAGITTGCSASEFCPEAGVTRGQMAGFLARGLGRAATGDGVIAFADLLDGAPIAATTITTGGIPGETGFLLVTASATIQGTDGVCPCDVGIVVTTGGESSPSSLAVARHQIDSGWWMGDTSVTWVFEVPSGTEQTIELEASGISWQGESANSFARGMITAVYIPFGPAGGSTLGTEAATDWAPAVDSQP